MDKEKMININASLVEEPVFSSFEKDGEEVKLALHFGEEVRKW